jgi:hypothetical protein
MPEYAVKLQAGRLLAAHAASPVVSYRLCARRGLRIT